MLVLMRRITVVAAMATGSCFSITAHASSDSDAQAAYEQGYRAAMAQVALDEARYPAARVPQSGAPVRQSGTTTFVDLKDTYSDGGDSEQVERIPVVNGVPQRPTISRSALASPAVVGIVPNPQSQVSEDEAVSEQEPADGLTVQQAIQKIQEWAAKLPHSTQGTTGAVDGSAAPAADLVPVSQPQTVASGYVPVRRYAAPPPPSISRTQPAPASSAAQPVWSQEFHRWVYLAQ